jgi:hypothetical protein
MRSGKKKKRTEGINEECLIARASKMIDGQVIIDRKVMIDRQVK